MKVFDHQSFLEVAVTGVQAQDIANIADGVLEGASFVLYGTFDGEHWHDLSSVQKPGDTYVLLAYAPKRMPQE